jgi:hypothetical protein
LEIVDSGFWNDPCFTYPLHLHNGCRNNPIPQSLTPHFTKLESTMRNCRLIHLATFSALLVSLFAVCTNKCFAQGTIVAGPGATVVVLGAQSNANPNNDGLIVAAPGSTVVVQAVQSSGATGSTQSGATGSTQSGATGSTRCSERGRWKHFAGKSRQCSIAQGCCKGCKGWYGWNPLVGCFFERQSHIPHYQRREACDQDNRPRLD